MSKKNDKNSSESKSWRFFGVSANFLIKMYQSDTVASNKKCGRVKGIFMKHVKINSVTTSILFTLSLITMDTYTNATKFYGSVHLADQTYTDLEISGTAHLTNVIIHSSALVYGSAYLADVACPELTVRGTMHVDAIVIKNPLFLDRAIVAMRNLMY